MKAKTVLSVLAAVVVSVPVSMVAAPQAAQAQVNVYITPGYHQVNGREWNTTCEKYSSNVTRCTTNIKASQVKTVGGKYQSVKGWVFNNMTYLPSPRASWGNNPLANSVSWTANDGRKWRTECDTAVTGRNGCRSYNMATVVEHSGSGFKKSTKWVFNNMVTFSTAQTTPPTTPTPTVPPTPPSGKCTSTKSNASTYRNTLAEECLFRLINNDRVKAGAKPLVRDTGLDTVARNWSTKMSQGKGIERFYHNPNYVEQILVHQPNAVGFSENIAYNYDSNTGQRVHDQFMNSPGHKANLMDPESTKVGLGIICESSGQCWTTENFIVV